MSSFFKGLNVTTAYMMRCNKNDKLNTLFCYGLVILRKQLAPHVRASPAGVFARKILSGWKLSVGLSLLLHLQRWAQFLRAATPEHLKRYLWGSLFYVWLSVWPCWFGGWPSTKLRPAEIHSRRTMTTVQRFNLALKLSTLVRIAHLLILNLNCNLDRFVQW